MNITTISPECANRFCDSCRLKYCACECHGPELITCENCEQDVPEDKITMTADDVPLCRECFDALSEDEDEPDYRDGDWDEEELQA